MKRRRRRLIRLLGELLRLDWRAALRNVCGRDAELRYGIGRTYGRTRLESLVYAWTHRSTPVGTSGRGPQPE